MQWRLRTESLAGNVRVRRLESRLSLLSRRRRRRSEARRLMAFAWSFAPRVRLLHPRSSHSCSWSKSRTAAPGIFVLVGLAGEKLRLDARRLGRLRRREVARRRLGIEAPSPLEKKP